jgi:hypothetical protein
MPQTRWNKGKTIVNSDAYNLAGDDATQSDTLNVIVPVASQAERDALAPPQGVYAGMAVARTDLPGVPVQTRDGSGVWSTQQTPKVWANTNVASGSGSSLLTNLQSGAVIPIIQAGSVVCTTDVNGYTNFTFPQAFPNGLMSVVITNGDNNATGKGVYLTLGSAASNTTTCYFAAVQAGGAGYANLPVRCNYVAVGW